MGKFTPEEVAILLFLPRGHFLGHSMARQVEFESPLQVLCFYLHSSYIYAGVVYDVTHIKYTLNLSLLVAIGFQPPCLELRGKGDKQYHYHYWVKYPLIVTIIVDHVQADHNGEKEFHSCTKCRFNTIIQFSGTSQLI